MEDTEMINYIRQNVEMGIDGIKVVMEYVDDSNFKDALKSQVMEYQQIYNKADELLMKHDGKPEDVKATAKAASHLAGKMKTLTDKSVPSIAESMIKGNTLGVTKIIRHKNEYNGKDPEIKDLCEKLLKTEENNIEQMKAFL